MDIIQNKYTIQYIRLQRQQYFLQTLNILDTFITNYTNNNHTRQMRPASQNCLRSRLLLTSDILDQKIDTLTKSQSEYLTEFKKLSSSSIFVSQDTKKYLRAVLKTKQKQGYLQYSDDFEIIQKRQNALKHNYWSSLIKEKTNEILDKIQINCYDDPGLNHMIRRNIKNIIYNIIEEFKKFKITKNDRIIKDIDQVALSIKSGRIKTLMQDQQKYQKNNYQKLEVFRRDKRITDYNIERNHRYQNNLGLIMSAQLSKVEFPVKQIILEKKRQLLNMK
ncbi:hypothetical protein SS50377_27587 [Spironucleus salmonicida]|uniref:Uncharacterized protein n=2 Tax=Spironucleus salmonicida TaxID=348837 RepID=A0A9P8LND5_9EUKA|nr:hypothetical protein SS50377_27587 [Spironucleus salmonicida]